MVKTKDFIKNQLQKRKSFIIYSGVGIFITILNIFLIWLFIDIFNIPTVIASTIVVGGLFLFKFYLYKKTGFA